MRLENTAWTIGDKVADGMAGRASRSHGHRTGHADLALTPKGVLLN
jgi:hypothetical protein